MNINDLIKDNNNNTETKEDVHNISLEKVR